METVNAKCVLLSAKGGVLECVSPEGEVVASFAVPPGRTRVSRYADLVPLGCEMRCGEGVEAFRSASRIVKQPYGEGAYASGANPDYQPTRASQLEREMRVQINRMKANSTALERRMRALEAVEHVPQAPAPAEVIEAEPARSPEPEVKGE